MQSGRGARTYWIDGRGLPGCKVEMGQLDGMGDGQEESTEEGTAGTQAGGWLSFYRSSSVLLYVRVCVNVKRGEGRQAGQEDTGRRPCELVLASCWELVVWSSGRHYAHTVTLIPPSSVLCPPTAAQSPRTCTSQPRAEQAEQAKQPRVQVRVPGDGRALPPSWRHGAWLARYLHMSLWASKPAWASLLSPGAIVSCWEAAALALILSIRP